MLNIFSTNKSEQLDELLSLLKNDELSTKNKKFFGKIVKTTTIENSNYFSLTLQMKENICNQFISLNTLSSFNIGDNIEFESKDIKLNSINDKIYIEIVKANIKKNKSYKDIINNNSPNFNFNIFRFIYEYNELELSHDNISCIYSIILRVKQVEKPDIQYEFYDIFNMKIPLDYSNISNLIEGQKIYIFNSLKLIKDANERYKLIPMKYFSIQLFDDSHILNTNKILIGDETIISLKGKIINFNLAENTVEIINGNNEMLSVELSKKLFKKISLNCDCYFKCFLQKKNGDLKPTEFSNITTDEKTILVFKFIKSNKFYNQIKIDDLVKDISNEEEIKFSLELNNEEKTILKKNIKLRRNNCDEEVSYDIEINKGKENTFNTYLGKDGKFSFQIYYQATDKEKLINDYQIKINNEDLKFNTFDSYGNNLKKRITFINVPHELFDTNQFSLEPKMSQNSIKILKLIKENENEYKFYISCKETKKYIIEYDKLNLELINSFYDNYSKSISELRNKSFLIKDEKNQYYNLFYGGECIQNYKKYIKKGFEEYIYNNNEIDYQFVKKLCFALIFYKKKEIDFWTVLSQYMGNIFNSIDDLEFIDRIKCLIALTNEYISQDDNNYDSSIVCIENNNYYEYEYIVKAHKLFLEIINDLTEESSLFHIIHQFNGEISNEIKTNILMYSGSILNVKDIKLEIYNNLNSFYLCSFKKRKTYGAIYNNTKVTILYPSSYSGGGKIKESEKEIQERKSSAVLIILFHELCGHLKTHINNVYDSPKTIYQQNLKVEEVKLLNSDSGFLLEHIFVKGSIEVKNFIRSENSKKLLDKTLYLGNNFDKLNKILVEKEDSIVKETEIEPDFIKEFFEKKQNNEETNKILSENYKDLGYHELTKLLSNMSEEELKQNKKIYDYYIKEFFSDPNKKY